MSLNFHLVNRIRQQIQTHGDRVAVRFQQAEGWGETSWTEFGKNIDAVSRALLVAGLAVQDRIAIFANNSAEWTTTDIGA